MPNIIGHFLYFRIWKINLTENKMKTLFLILVLSIPSYAQIAFEEYFLNKSLRLDYFHIADDKSESFAYNEMKEEPYWGGSKINLIDTLELGYYMAKVFDVKSGNLIYSRGYSNLLREWQTTDEAKYTTKALIETITLPFPKDSVRIEIHSRDRQNNFKKVWEYTADPNSYFVSTERRLNYPNFKVHYSGDTNKKYDIVFLPDGYTADELDKFKKDCERYAGYLFKYAPYSENKDNINIWGVAAPSMESGTDIPGDSVYKNTLLNTSFYTFDSERYLMTSDYKAVRDAAANAPYDQIYILVNTDKYGGGAIYNYYNVSVIYNPQSEKVFIHELGHGLAGLADEYYTSDVAYNDYYPVDVEPWEVNITTMVDFDSKWKHLLDEITPIPTPRTKEYENTLGVFEGGGYSAKGVYSPVQNSIMNGLNADGYNLPSLILIQKVLDFYSE